MTSLKFLRVLKDKLETPYVVSYFFNEPLTGGARLLTSRRCFVIPSQSRLARTLAPPMLSTRPPLQLLHLRVFGMLRIEAAQFKFRAVARERGPHPAARTAFLEDETRRRQIDELHAARVLLHVPVVRVTEDERLHLPMPRE